MRLRFSPGMHSIRVPYPGYAITEKNELIITNCDLMDYVNNLWQLFSHLDKYLDILIPRFGMWTYWLAAFIIFAEVGLVITGFLPGDSLLFALGALSARGSLHLGLLLLLLCLAAWLGNLSNYQIGMYLNPLVEKKKKIPFLSHDDLLRAHQFFTDYGRIAIVLARFFPVVRSFAPLAAGISKMDFLPFTLFSLIGCFSWVCSYVLAGYFFGNIPFIKNNFMLVIVGIIVISLIPTVLKIIKTGQQK